MFEKEREISACGSLPKQMNTMSPRNNHKYAERYSLQIFNSKPEKKKKDKGFKCSSSAGGYMETQCYLFSFFVFVFNINIKSINLRTSSRVLELIKCRFWGSVSRTSNSVSFILINHSGWFWCFGLPQTRITIWENLTSLTTMLYTQNNFESKLQWKGKGGGKKKF